nr:MAG TPA: hypothetical protein [Caudoviricetes sp.]
MQKKQNKSKASRGLSLNQSHPTKNFVFPEREGRS